MNIMNIQTGSDTSSMKVLKEGTGSFNTPAGNNVSNAVAIPHGYESDLLIPHVSLHASDTNQIYITPLIGGSRYVLLAEIDSTNLYINVNLSSAGDPYPVIIWTYNYRILIP